jgi:hypothetical protein
MSISLNSIMQGRDEVTRGEFYLALEKCHIPHFDSEVISIRRWQKGSIITLSVGVGIALLAFSTFAMMNVWADHAFYSLPTGSAFIFSISMICIILGLIDLIYETFKKKSYLREKINSQEVNKKLQSIKTKLLSKQKKIEQFHGFRWSYEKEINPIRRSQEKAQIDSLRTLAAQINL